MTQIILTFTKLPLTGLIHLNLLNFKQVFFNAIIQTQDCILANNLFVQEKSGKNGYDNKCSSAKILGVGLSILNIL